MPRTRSLDYMRILSRMALVMSLAALGPVGCGSSSNTSGSSATAATTSSRSGDPGSAAASAHPIDVCAKLPAGTVARLSGKAVTTANPQTRAQPQEYGCNYTNADDSVQLEVTVFEHDAAFSYDAFLTATKGAHTMSGLGDKAFYDNDGTMYVLAGNNLIQVNGVNSADACAALARPILEGL